MGRKAINSGVRPKGRHRIEFDFEFEGVRYRPTLKRVPSEANLRRAAQQLGRIKQRIAAGVFVFAEEFPDFRFRGHLEPAFIARTCNQVFDEFLAECDSRVERKNLAFVTADGYRKLLAQIWRPVIGSLEFEAVKYSTLIKVGHAYRWAKKTYNNSMSALRCAFDYGYQDHPEKHNPATGLKCLRITRKDRPPVDPFPIAEAEVLIAAIHQDWGEAQTRHRLCSGCFASSSPVGLPLPADRGR
jgi:integrase